MDKWLSLATTKNKQGRFYFRLRRSVLSIHVHSCVDLAVVQLLSNSLAKVDIDLRMSLYNEIVLSGGNTMFEGFAERFIKDLRRGLPN